MPFRSRYGSMSSDKKSIEEIFEDFERDDLVKQTHPDWETPSILVTKKNIICPKKRVSFLGHIISERGVIVDPEKVRAVERMQEPSFLKDVRAFFSLVVYYRKLFLGFGKKENLFTVYLIGQINFNGVQTTKVL